MAAILTPSQMYEALKKHEIRIFRKKSVAFKATGVPWSSWLLAGIPRAATVNASGMSGAVCNKATQGGIAFPDPTAGKDGYMFGMDVTGSVSAGGRVFLIDRLWHNSGIAVTTTTAQTVNSVTWPARDENGTTNGEGVLVALEVSTATGNGAAITNMTLSYTNSDGTAGRTATIDAKNVCPGGFPASANVGTFVTFRLQAGDRGVRSIQSVTLGTSLVSGAVQLVAYRILCVGKAMSTAGPLYKTDPLGSGFEKRYAGTCAQLMYYPSTTSAGTLQGLVYFGEY